MSKRRKFDGPGVRLRLSIDPQKHGLGTMPAVIMDRAILGSVDWNHLYYRPRSLEFAASAQPRSMGGLIQHAIDIATKKQLLQRGFVYPLGRAITTLAEERFRLRLSNTGEASVVAGGAAVDFPNSVLYDRDVHAELTCFSRVRSPSDNFSMPSYAEFFARVRDAAEKAAPDTPAVWNKMVMLYVLLDLKVDGRKNVSCHGVYLAVGAIGTGTRTAGFPKGVMGSLLRGRNDTSAVANVESVPKFSPGRPTRQNVFVSIEWRDIDAPGEKGRVVQLYSLEKAEAMGVGLGCWIKTARRTSRTAMTVAWVAGGTKSIPIELLKDSPVPNAFFGFEEAVPSASLFVDWTIFQR